MGADYRTSNRTTMGFHAPTVPTNAVRYFTNDAFEIAVQTANIIVYEAGIIRNLYVDSGAAPGAGESFIFVVYINNLATAVTATIAGAVATAANDVVNAVAIAAGDQISIEVTSSLNSTNPNLRAAVTLVH